MDLVVVSEASELLRHCAILPVELRTSNTVRHQRNVDVLDTGRIAASFDQKDCLLLLLGQSTRQHGTRCPTTHCHSATQQQQRKFNASAAVCSYVSSANEYLP